MSTEVLFGLLGLALLIAVAALVSGLRRRGDGSELALLQSQLHALTEQTGQQLEALRAALQQGQGQMLQTLDGTRRTLDHRLEGAGQVFHDLHQQLGRLEESARGILAVGRDVHRLEQLLRAPKLRGNLGELLLQELLAQVLPAGSYALQHRFQDGATVDAVIVLRSGLVPVDAKFPLDNARRLAAAGDDAERLAARRLFLRDLRRHVDDVAAKYIRPDEGTFDFALLYIPAEGVYHQAVSAEPAGDSELDLQSYALARGVIPVSPHSFYAYLQTVLLGLRGLRVEQQARQVLDRLASLRREMGLFQEVLRKLGQHLENAHKQYAEASRRAGRIEARLDAIETAEPAAEDSCDAPGVDSS